MSFPNKSKYPLLEEILSIKGLPLQPTYSNRDVATIFGVSIRAIQDRIASGQLVARDLPGRARFLSLDLEQFIENSRKPRG
jgi:transposase